MWAVKHIDGKYLHIQYVTHVHSRSFIELVESEFLCFKTQKEAEEYIEDGEESYYSYSELIRKEDLKAVQFIEVKS